MVIENVFLLKNSLEANMKRLMKLKQDTINYKEQKQSQVICSSESLKVKIWKKKLKAFSWVDIH